MRVRHRVFAPISVSSLLLVAAAGCNAPPSNLVAVGETSAEISGLRPLVTLIMALPGPVAPKDQQWTNKSQTVNAAVPDNWTYGVDSNMTIDAVSGSCSQMKSVQLDLGITHPRLADLYITASMVSSDGSYTYKTVTVFDGPTAGRNGMTQAQMQKALAGDLDVSLLTYASDCSHLRVNVADWAPGSTGTLDSFTVKVRTAWFPFAHDNAYYTNLLFGPSYPNVNGFYQEESRGNFGFSNAGVYGPVPWGNWHVGETDEQHVQDIIAWLDALNFNFAAYDANHDGTVDSNELQVVQVENSGDIGGANRGGCLFANKSGVNVCVSAALVSEQVEFASLAHEISHTLGTVDLYGTWNQECYSNGLTLMSCTITFEDDPASYYHDPWHRSRVLGWLSPLQPGCTAYAMGDESYRDPASGQRTLPAVYRNPKNPDHEYYLFEYRKPNGYDLGVADTGIVAWHISENADGSPYQGPNGDQPIGHYIYALSPDTQNGQKVGGSRAWKPSDNAFQLKWLDGSPVGYAFSVAEPNNAGNMAVLDCVDPSRFNFSISPTQTSLAAGNSESLTLSTNIGSCSPVQYSITSTPPGVNASLSSSAVYSTGSSYLYLAIPYNTAPETGIVTVTGTCGGQSESQSVQVTTTPCVPTGCASDACGTISDGCGNYADCGGCAAGYSCQGGTCQLPQQKCTTPRQCCIQAGGDWINGRCY